MHFLGQIILRLADRPDQIRLIWSYGMAGLMKSPGFPMSIVLMSSGTSKSAVMVASSPPAGLGIGTKLFSILLLCIA